MRKAQNQAEMCLALTRHTRKPGRQRPGSIACGIITDYLTFIRDYIKVIEFIEWLDLVRISVP